MPEEREGEEAVAELVRTIVAGSDTIGVPAEMLEERVEAAPPAARSLYAQILTMGIAEKIIKEAQATRVERHA